MLTLAPRRITDAEREALAAELAKTRTRTRAMHERTAAVYRDGDKARISLTLMAAGLCALPLLFNLLHPAGNPTVVALMGTLVVVLLGLAVWFSRQPASEPPPLVDDPRSKRIAAAIARGEVRVIEIRADAAVALRADVVADGGDERVDAWREHGRRIAGHLLRGGPDQIVYVACELYRDIDRGRLPNTHLRISCTPTLEIQQVEALGERIEPLAVDELPERGRFWGDDSSAIVWTPSSDTYESYALSSPELCHETYEGFADLATPLLPRAYR